VWKVINYTVATCSVFLLLCLNMLSAARIAQYNDCVMGRAVQGLNSVTGKRSLYQGVYRVGGVFPGGWYSHLSSADLKNVWRYTSTPLHSFVANIWTTRVGIREIKLQDS